MLISDLDLDSTQGHGVQESTNFCAIYLFKIQIDLNGIWCVVGTFLCYDPHDHFISSDQNLIERNFNTGLFLDTAR